MKKLAITKKIEAYIVTHPEAKAKAVAEKFDVTVAAVYAARNTVNKATKDAFFNASQAHFGGSVQEAETTAPISPSPKREPITTASSPTMTLKFVRANLSASEYKGFLKGNIMVYSHNLCQGEPNAKDVGDLIGLITALNDTVV